MNTTRLVINSNSSEVKIIINISLQVNFRTRSLKTAQNKKTYP